MTITAHAKDMARNDISMLAFLSITANGIQVWLVACSKLPLTLMRVMNYNNLNSERIMKDKQYLYTMYNATSTDDGTGELETYENWLERQLLSRIEKLEALEKANGQESEQRQLTIPDVSISVCPKCHASEVYENRNGDGECAICGHTWQTGC